MRSPANELISIVRGFACVLASVGSVWSGSAAASFTSLSFDGGGVRTVGDLATARAESDGEGVALASGVMAPANTAAHNCKHGWDAAPERCAAKAGARAAKALGLAAALQDRIENVTGTVARVFDAHDDAGHGLDGLKAVRFGDAFLGVYHSTVNGVLYQHLGYSYDLMHWRFRCDLDTNASQAAVTRLPDNSWLVAYEHSVPADHRWINLRFRWYADDNAMLTCTPTSQYDAPRTLARTVEGTPNFYRVNWHGSITNSSVLMGLHYLKDSIHVDRQASATLTNFKSLSKKKAPRYDALFEDLGYAGNFGDRDAFAFKGDSYVIWEAQRNAFEFETWRTFLYSTATRQAYQLAMRTPGHSKAFGNPSVTSVMVAGHPYLFISQFVFGEGAAPGEAGELLYLADAV